MCVCGGEGGGGCLHLWNHHLEEEQCHHLSITHVTSCAAEGPLLVDVQDGVGGAAEGTGPAEAGPQGTRSQGGLRHFAFPADAPSAGIQTGRHWE